MSYASPPPFDLETGLVDLAPGEVGTFVWARGGGDQVFGAEVAGSSLQPTSATCRIDNIGSVTVTFLTGSALSGTWRCMGRADASAYSGDRGMSGACLWQRVL